MCASKLSRVSRCGWPAARLSVALLLSLVTSLVSAQDGTRNGTGPRAGVGTVALPTTRVFGATMSGPGGGAQADFDTLIDLIESTVAPDTWETVGGDGSLQGFPGGVYVDSAGVLQQISAPTADKLALHWKAHAIRSRASTVAQEMAQASPLRKVSLTRLLAAWQAERAAGGAMSEGMRYLAGLERIDWLVFDRERRDVILAGPAGPWSVDRHGRTVSRRSGRPVIRLEDWIVVYRNAVHDQGQFMCAITPTAEGLAAAQTYVAAASQSSVAAGKGQRAAYLAGLRDALGLQRVEIAGLAAGTRVSRVLVEADHHMKQVGIGLQPGTPEVPSYLQRLADAGQIPVEMEILRWWFTLHPSAAQAVEAGESYLFGPQAVRVLSENELLTERGERIHTGQSHPLNAEFAQDFTRHFNDLASKYPIYADLDNIFRWAIVAALVQAEAAAGQVTPACIAWADVDPATLPVARAPRWIPSIVNDFSLNRRQFLAAVSGGVQFQTTDVAQALAARPTTVAGRTSGPRSGAQSATAPTLNPTDASTDAWWWD